MQVTECSPAAAGGIQSRMAGSSVSISMIGSTSGRVSPSRWKRRITSPSQGASKSNTDFALSTCTSDCPLRKRSPSATCHSMIVASISDAPCAGRYNGILNNVASIVSRT